MRKNKLLTMIAAAALLLPVAAPLTEQKPVAVQAARHHRKAVRRTRRSRRRKKSKKAKYTWQIQRVPELTFTKTTRIYLSGKKHGKRVMRKAYVGSLPYTIKKGLAFRIPSSKTVKVGGKVYYKVLSRKHRRSLYVLAKDAKFSWGITAKRVRVKSSKSKSKPKANTGSSSKPNSGSNNQSGNTSNNKTGSGTNGTSSTSNK